MVILSAVTASVVSEIGLGSEPAFKVPDYDFRSPGGNIQFPFLCFHPSPFVLSCWKILHKPKTELMRAVH